MIIPAKIRIASNNKVANNGNTIYHHDQLIVPTNFSIASTIVAAVAIFIKPA
jgi:hypothetical protein